MHGKPCHIRHASLIVASDYERGTTKYLLRDQLDVAGGLYHIVDHCGRSVVRQKTVRISAHMWCLMTTRQRAPTVIGNDQCVELEQLFHVQLRCLMCSLGSRQGLLDDVVQTRITGMYSIVLAFRAKALRLNCDQAAETR